MDRDAFRSSLKLLRKNGYTRAQFNWLRRQGTLLDLLAPNEKVIDVPRTRAEANKILSSSVFKDLDFMENKLFSTIRSIRGKVGVLSLSGRYDSLPMWANYAKQAHGFIVVLEDLDRCFGGDETGSLNVLKPVTYTKRFIGMTFDPSTQDRLFFSKLSDWSYERERRVVAALSACYRSADGKHCLRQVDPLHVTQVICGWHVTPTGVLSLRDDLSRVNHSISVMSTVFSGAEIHLRREMN